LDVTMACGNADCGQKMEVEFQEQDLVPYFRGVH